jgi:hypothetical protein
MNYTLKKVGEYRKKGLRFIREEEKKKRKRSELGV